LRGRPRRRSSSAPRAAPSAVYLVNDLRDVAGDRAHPTKRDRPIAAGLVRPAQAALAAAALVVLALGGAWLIGSPFLAVVAGYLALMLAYSFGLKRLAIVDVGAIAAGFVLRAVGGAAAIGAPVSPWLSLCALLLALVLGFGKRRHELSALGAAAARHRANLAAYSLPLLDRLIGAVASATVAAYAVYAVDAPNAPPNHAMLLTVPFVAFALVRYLYLLHRRGLGGAPEELLVADPPLLSCIAGWGLTSLAVLYLVR